MAAETEMKEAVETADAAQDRAALLAETFGIEPSALDDALRRALIALVDDEVELLALEDRARLKEKLCQAAGVAATNTPAGLSECSGCQNLSLPRYRPEDGCCRVCGAPVSGKTEEAPGAKTVVARGPRADTLFHDLSVKAQADTPVAARDGPAIEVESVKLELKNPLRLDLDNEDWDVVEERQLSDEKKKQLEAERLRREEEERRRLEEEEQRLAIGILLGARAGQVERIADADPKKPPSGLKPIAYMVEKTAKLWIPPGATMIVDNSVASGTVELKGGTMVRGLLDADDLCVIEENGELHAVGADPIHFERADGQPGGPWPYWNEPARIGTGKCEILIADNEVEDVHARVVTFFGRVLLVDESSEDAGVYVDGKRVKDVILKPGLELTLSSPGPKLKVVAGQAESKMVKAAAMKPARYVRTSLIVEAGEHKQKVFVFARREVRFGQLGSKDDKVENELVLRPYDETQAIAQKQGSFALTREGMTLRLDDRKVPMALDEKPLKPGENVQLPRRFEIDIGDGGLTLKGQVFRSPTHVERPASHGQLGVEGGHPFECVRIERMDGVEHVYVMLVRQIRVGSGAGDAIQIPGTSPSHAIVLMQRGTFQIVAPKEQVVLDEGDDAPKVELKPGEAYPLKIGTTIRLGEAQVRFDVTNEEDFQVHQAVEAPAE